MQVIFLNRGSRPRSFMAKRERTIENWTRGLSADVIVVFGKISERLRNHLRFCVLYKKGQVLVVE